MRDGDLIEIIVDRNNLTGSINLVGTEGKRLTPGGSRGASGQPPAAPDLRPIPHLPDDTRLWAALQQVSGGTWGGCVYDVDTIIKTLEAGRKALAEQEREEQQRKAL